MSANTILLFITRQINEVRVGGLSILLRKVKFFLIILSNIPAYIVAIIPVLFIRSIKPWLLVRIGQLNSTRIGHFAANTELYLCEQDAGINVPNQKYINLFYFNKIVCNKQLAKMWKRTLYIWPAWILSPMDKVNNFIPGGISHKTGDSSRSVMDVHNLLDRFPPHLQFTNKETNRGAIELKEMGIPKGQPYVCLIVRDSAYLESKHSLVDWNYHNYRDSNIDNYVLAAEKLAKRGYYIIRMGAKVHKSFETSNPKIIDYATNGMRSDFMDIYLGANCAFCISTGTGWDEIPEMFRRPIGYVNFVALAYLHTYRNEFVSITKRHVFKESQKAMSLNEIFSHGGSGYFLHTSDYESKGVQLIENSPEEIHDLVIEMDERFRGTWQTTEDDKSLQRRFWDIFPSDELDPHRGLQLHGEVRGHFGTAFLRNNRKWLE